MRDWIGTGVSLLGTVTVLVGFAGVLRLRTTRRSRDADRATPPVEPVGASIAEDPETRRGDAGYRRLRTTVAGLILVEGGQLIRIQSWPWAVFHGAGLALAFAGLLLVRRDRRKPARRLPDGTRGR